MNYNLTKDTQQILQKTDNERIEFIEKKVWINYDRAQKIIEKKM